MAGTILENLQSWNKLANWFQRALQSPLQQKSQTTSHTAHQPISPPANQPTNPSAAVCGYLLGCAVERAAEEPFGGTRQ